MREIVLDTETTGLNPAEGHRIVEIGCVELFNRIPTSKTFHAYINPERDMPDEALAVHGLTAEFLKSHHVFRDVAKRFLDFIGDSKLVIHNAEFDHAFLNFELKRLNMKPIDSSRLVDTLTLARRKHPGKNDLDSLCARYGVDASERLKHGALLDAELLSEVYVELIEARQASLVLSESRTEIHYVAGAVVGARKTPLASRLTEDDLSAHREFIRTIKEPVWADYGAGYT